jgi:glycosyltransferase involved in cell wall biosynthesis
MEKKYKLSVIMPVYNGQKYLRKALVSILNQTYKDFELIIINDGSTDETHKILSTIRDNRLKVLNNTKNIGVTKSLNIALKLAQGEYIARADADEINIKKRFQEQVDFLNSNPDYVGVGSKFHLIDEDDKPLQEKEVRVGYKSISITDKEIRQKLIIRNQIIHPSVMIRKKALKRVGYYREIFNGAEDYDLWFRLLRIGKFCNLPTELIKRRWHKEVVTRNSHIKIELLALVVRLLNLDFALKNI